jgi:flagellar basal-body rod protein FlgF
MDRMIYVAMSGANQTQLAQTINNHNLANVNTAGFRADLEAMRAMPLFGPGFPTRVYAMAERPGVDLSAGTVTTTGRELDIAVNGDGWIAVQAPDGTEAYTRAGDLRVTTAGQLVTGAGHAVMGTGGPIAIPPSEKIEIGGDGTITLRPLGQSAATLATADQIKLVNPPKEMLQKGPDGLFRLKDGSPAPADPNVRIQTGSLESSNVSAVDAMVTMITLARQYEMQVRMMRIAEDNDAAAAEIVRLG